MTLTQFIKKYLGTKVDFDGRNGPQCVDLARRYFADVLEIPQPPSVEGAKDLIKNSGQLAVTKESVLADYTRGDVLVWDAAGRTATVMLQYWFPCTTRNILLYWNRTALSRTA